MHRVVTNAPDGKEVDHLNHDTLDNRKDNLRVTNHRENCSNKRNHSPYGVGVYKSMSGGRFHTKATVNGKCVYIGTYDTPEEAAKAREQFLRKV
jgi:hypothetical protein